MPSWSELDKKDSLWGSCWEGAGEGRSLCKGPEVGWHLLLEELKGTQCGWCRETQREVEATRN